ncbi:MraY family glycosyltransferase [Clostridium beijerinckii]|uniref:UDP-N-acetylmuramyl pentapeptide phosphotransferase/UDP-N-acetylglucosamine-1-phosphate transferase n=1 Tax=Clostridium beijerinckii TaxID=1520 RepID=A0AAX0AWK8_CLOBE|nr:MraY family glycosyltransferase [Clostridium beijerinckii]NRT87277.1 UDP-N-acetylmuramyl pentapeptide phosphotransferase/UDP-N-acetylglucosamine-1-phosphate transferase [Clostridium beijerinckii]NYC72708.1 UDP-N-acetylmuramyl pentapeptide phosphotransferase/UDP-N-acetylglucosamine-1-phosphate transferase [Clostridium beijerinckii]
MSYFYAFLIAYLIVYFITPILIKLAIRFDFVDKPTKRKNQKKPVPLVGGIGLLIAFFISSFIFIKPIDKKFLCILVSSLLVFFIGIVDDWYKTKGKEFAVFPRLIIQIIAALMIYHSEIVFKGFTNPWTNNYIELPWELSLLLSVLWILGVTTVINWSDGMDGLAGSLSAIASSNLFIVALIKNQTDSAMMSILLLGSLVGFLKYNKYPAKTYMGDSGANFSGFILSIIALEGAFKQATIVSIVIPILALGVPIFDNLYVVVRRIINFKPIYEADASQIHHRLLSTGLNQKQVVIFICLTSLCFSLCSIIILLLKV